jgi:hypothetical protein
VFEALPHAGVAAWGTIIVKNNPGAALCDAEIARAKNWEVTTY